MSPRQVERLAVARTQAPQCNYETTEGAHSQNPGRCEKRADAKDKVGKPADPFEFTKLHEPRLPRFASIRQGDIGGSMA